MSLNAVLGRMAGDLNIRRGNKEDKLSWRCRVAYSVAVKRGLDALWEKGEGEAQDGTVPLVHITQTIKQVLQAFYMLSPDMEEVALNLQGHLRANQSVEAVLGELLQKGGCFYHCPYRAAPATLAMAELAGTVFLRGLPSENTRCMSGGGMYVEAPVDGRPEDVAQMFGLQKVMSYVDLERFEDSLPEVQREKMEDWEFLNLDITRNNREYWRDKPDKGVLSLARKKREAEQSVVLYRYDGRGFICRPLPEFFNSETHYLTFAVALLSQKHALPPIVVEDDGPLISLRVGYLFPPAEETFFRLYSWPDMVWKRNPYFSRVMARPVYEAFHRLMTSLGYTFLEEAHG